jgi:hypothetical protein
MSEFCPLCLSKGRKSELKYFQMNLTEAARMCVDGKVGIFSSMQSMPRTEINHFVLKFQIKKFTAFDVGLLHHIKKKSACLTLVHYKSQQFNS